METRRTWKLYIYIYTLASSILKDATGRKMRETERKWERENEYGGLIVVFKSLNADVSETS